MKDSVKDFLHGTKQAVLVTIVLLLLCGFLFRWFCPVFL